jgi:hypothetical protein
MQPQGRSHASLRDARTGRGLRLHCFAMHGPHPLLHCLAMQPQARFAERHLPSHQLCCARLHCFAMRASVQRNDEPALASRRPHGGSAFRRTDAWNGLGEAPVERNAEPSETCEACKACGGLPRSCNQTILTNRICNTTELKDVYLSLD